MVDQTRTVKNVVMFSTGLSSAYLSDLVIKEHGKENTILLFTDTKWEDEDNYRFLNEVSEYLNHPITIRSDGRTPEDVFFDERFMGNFGTAPCSKVLKMRQTVIFIEELRSSGFEPILYFGIGHKESQRAPRIEYNYSHNCLEPVECRFPLIHTEIDNRMMRRVIEETWGIKVPRMYDLGFSHANCGGRCIKGGFKHYRNLHKVWPDRFNKQKQMEKKFCEEINHYTILRRNNDSFSLEQLLLNIEQGGEQLDIFDFEVPCECVF